ncbi:MAG: hypothetical protein AVDCRST_MAG88-3362 [uncultured Thermomicrobiales bacterium]|uniref:Uncharacterized protein n=1 Tax=uncultured Thermomicrobiales bacterium TaxID=1645740 RepID=A0A6J4VNM0_9BACT|nr:MAG: hypothetical protein AVDCRST_MAG88-3362 [uncultured Thermomicrobiales bacterium]
MLRYIILAVCIAYFALLASLAVAVRRAAPGPSDQTITGIGIGSYRGAAGIAFLSGRRLACVPDERDGLHGSRCRVMVAGETLELSSWRNPPSNPNQLGGRCEARYAGQTWPCRIGSRHVHVHWFAYLDEPLGLRPEQLDTLRREHFFENVGEEPFFAAWQVLPPLSAIVVAGGVLAGFWPWARRGPRVAMVALIGALAAFPCTFVAVLTVTSGLWD